MPGNRGAFIADDEIAVHAPDLPRTGHRISLDLAEEVYPRLGREAIACAVERLAVEVVYRHQAEIRRAVEGYVLNREWAEPIIREEISRAVRSIITDMLTNSALGQALAPTPDSPEPTPPEPGP
jgi:hypothetical protein